MNGVHGYHAWRLVSLWLFFVLLTGCGGGSSDNSEPPVTDDVVANFTLQAADLTVTFNASDSTGMIARYSWDFGDGSTGEGKSASHSYAMAGAYTVTLTVTDTQGVIAVRSVSISPLEPDAILIANFTRSINGLTVSLDASSSRDKDSSIAGYYWDFGDGSTDTGQSVSHTYKSAGSYLITLIVTDDTGASASQGITIHVTAANVAPVASFSHSSMDLNASVDASASSDSDGTIASYQWDFGDGSSGSGVTASHSYASAGLYLVELIVTDSRGLTASYRGFVDISAASQPTASFTHTESGLRTLLVATASSDFVSPRYEWDFGDGQIGEGRTLSHTYATDGSYTVMLTVTNSSLGLSVTTQSVITIGGGSDPSSCIGMAPTASFTTQNSYQVYQFDASGSSAPGCSITAYQWDFGEPASGSHNQSTRAAPTHTYQSWGLYTVTLTVTDSDGRRSAPVSALAFARKTPGYNDTGLTTCNDGTSAGACPVVNHPGQDAESGRDVTANDDSDGHAGFSFTKISRSGEPLDGSATNWACVQDNVTGLLWEKPTPRNAFIDTSVNTYSWYNLDASRNGGDSGTRNGGACSSSGLCDTQHYVDSINSSNLCGYSDWRVPSITELQDLVNYGQASDYALVSAYFPASVTVGDLETNFDRYAYWSSSSVAGSATKAWAMKIQIDPNSDSLFLSSSASKSDAKRLLLVRGRQ